MVYHEWGDTDFDWNSLYEAELFIFNWVKTKSGCRIMMKEKYGTLRYEVMFPPVWLTNTYKPIHRFLKKIPGLTKETDLGTCLRFYVFNNPLENWYRRRGRKALNEAIKIAVWKWPHIRKEIEADIWWLYE